MQESVSEKDTTIKERDSQLSTFTRQLDELNIKLKKSDETRLESDKMTNRVSQLTETERLLRLEITQLTEKLQIKETEYSSSLSTIASQNEIIQSEPLRLKDLEDRIQNLDQDLETSKRLFEVKSIEHDQFKLKISELESKIFDAEETGNRKQDDVEALKREYKEAKRELNNRNSDFKKLELEIAQVRKEAAFISEEAELKISNVEKELGLMVELEQEKNKLEEKLGTLNELVKIEKVFVINIESE